jgi:DNA-directed RNA polymerase subunit P
MEYICYTCGKHVTLEDIAKRIRCPYCGGKILFKERPEIVKRVKAR